MDTNPHTLRHNRVQTAIALVPTLLVLALMTSVVVLFFSVARVQLQSSSDTSAAYDIRHLQDIAINIAIAQIREGSTEANSLWISQPGAIRTYSQTGEPSRIYKLYSSRDMLVTASSLTSPSALNLTGDVPGNWNEFPNIYGDLNRPVVKTDGSISFPIVDPRAMDPDDIETPEGFSYSASHAVGAGDISGVISEGPASQRRLPMPVAWVYILKDGSMGTLDPSGTFVPYSGQKLATNDNPIVGRIAFWTDDESSKVNINTASEAIFWDTPRCATPEDIEFAKTLPAKNEVQRFGGHPATTCLSSIFLPGRRLDATDTTDKETLRAIYEMVPRVSAAGGMLGGGDPVTFDDDRLYPTVDEFLLDQEHEEQPFFEDDPGRLRRLRFFLTANSRAPETTAAGSPRVALWPVHYDPDADEHTTSFDKLIAFCSTLGTRRYHLGRWLSTSSYREYSDSDVPLFRNQELGYYLMRMGSDNRFGYPLSFEDKYDPDGTHVANGLKHNLGTSVLCFLEAIRQTNLHDNSLSSLDKSPREPVIPYGAQLYWWKRGSNEIKWTGVHGQTTTMSVSTFQGPIRTAIHGQTTEKWSNGIGREYTLSEFGICLNLAAEHESDGSKTNPDLVDYLKLPEGYKALQMGFVFEGFCAGQGFTMIAPASSVRPFSNDYRSFDRLFLRSSVGDHHPGHPNTNLNGDGDGIAPPTQSNHLGINGWGRLSMSVFDLSKRDWWVGWGGSGGRSLYAGVDLDGMVYSGGNPAGDAGEPDLFPPGAEKHPAMYSRGFFMVPGDEDTVEIVATYQNNQPIGVLELEIGDQRNGGAGGRKLFINFPAGNAIRVPVPEEPSNLPFTWNERYTRAKTDGFADPEIIDPNDVLRTFVARHGDYRITYMHEREGWGMTRERRVMVPHPLWNPNSASYIGDAAAADTKIIHSFTQSGGNPEPGAYFGREIVDGAGYAGSRWQPDFPYAPSDPLFSANVPSFYPHSVDPQLTRDFDTGVGMAPDGAYYGKPDDTARVSQRGGNPPYFHEGWDGIFIGPSGTIEFQPDSTIAPNQMIPSAILFGSIPSMAYSGIQWTTFLFRPDITPRGHVGSAGNTIQGNREGAPPDHALLDWFWMPVVQPYAISEPFSTAGKLNMNYRIAPFSYIKRATGLHAVLKSEQMLAIPTSAGNTYKNYSSSSSNTGWRQPIDAKTTLLQWEDRFDKGEFFRTPSEVCEQFLVPENKGISASNAASVRTAMTNFWNQNKLTGDNVLERPYANIYPRLTTRSNAYRVHYLVQTIQKGRSSDSDKFDPERDTITGESQGDALVERAIDPNDPQLLEDAYDFIGNTTPESIDNLYTYRIRHLRRFTR